MGYKTPCSSVEATEVYKVKKRPLLLMLILLFSSVAWATTIQLEWDANTEQNLVGYRIYQSLESGVYSFDTPIEDISAGTETVTFTVTEKGRVFWVATAYDNQGLESGPSNEVSAFCNRTKPSKPARIVKGD
jgi:hypothetical protein